MKTTQTQKPPIQANCATCKYFQDFGEPTGRECCQAFDQMARQQHNRTGDCTLGREAVESAQQPAPQPKPQQMQPAGLACDAIGCQLRPTFEAPQRLEKEPPPTSKLKTEFGLGEIHGRNDCLAGWHPIYTQALTEYATGYLSGYNAVLNPIAQQPLRYLPAEWSVSLDPRWGIYQAWVKDRCIGHGTTYVEAERKAQAYIATSEMIHRQNQAVMASYAVSSGC